MKQLAISGGRFAMALLIGAVTALIELPLMALTGVVLLLVLTWQRGRQAVLRPTGAAARRATEYERRRLVGLTGVRISDAYTDAQALRYLAVRAPLGLLGAVVLMCVLIGCAYGGLVFYGWFITDVKHPGEFVMSSLAGLLLLFFALQSIYGVARLEGKLARHFLGPSHQDELERRISELAASRAGIVEAVQEERRRIERDLHDGVQQSVVALGMLIGRALRSRDQQHVDRLLLQARDQAQSTLGELREVTWRIYPKVLEEAGLRAALESVAERCPLPFLLQYGLGTRAAPEPDKPEATAVYYVVSEAANNAVKHSRATVLSADVSRTDSGVLLVKVDDNGIGGADPTGQGLIGLARRVEALDGRLRVDSPPGGPTTITAEFPCA
ncbi:sensor histidine kinase [Streptomyces sp. NPDC050504]|uniref:sensor histidine kinase n=1 Tax=Streptomyces sp. NPDC050504 TaxID=3365618 RepID=UPI003789C9C3